MPDALERPTPLTPDERKKLTELEVVVERHLKSFFEVVHAMRTIKLERLWRADYDSWEGYVERKWQMSRQHSYRLLDAGEIIEQVKSVTQGDTGGLRLPASERPYRQIKALLDQNIEPGKVVELLKQADSYTESVRDIEARDILKAADDLKLVAKPARVVFELKAEWGQIRDELAGVVKFLEKHKDLGEQVKQLKGLLERVTEAVKHCPIPAKPSGKAKIKTSAKSKTAKR